MIIAIAGELNSGKDTVAKMIQYYFGKKSAKENPYPPLDFFISNYNSFWQDQDGGIGGWQIKKFAYKLKKTVSDFTGCTMEQLEDADFKENMCYNVTTGDIMHMKEILGKAVLYVQVQDVYGYEDNSWVTFRVLLQDFGMKMRSSFSMIHINGLFADYSKDCNWIISDLRLPDEADAVKARDGIIIKIIRDKDYHVSSTHISERGVKQIKADFTIMNDGTIEDLYEKVKKFLLTLDNGN